MADKLIEAISEMRESEAVAFLHDLGVDVTPETFVQKVSAVKPDVVALSGFLTLAFDSMKTTIAALKAAGLRDGLKVMVGGGTVDDRVRVYSGAVAFGSDATAAVSLARQWVGGN